MAEASISIDQDQFSCPVCLDLLKDAVTIPCGHSFCRVCIKGHWDQDDQRGVYSCPQCRQTFTPRPVLCRKDMLDTVVEKLKRIELQATSPAHCYTGPGVVDFCPGRKRKDIEHSSMDLDSYCETHLKPHHGVSTCKKHKLAKEEKICCRHGEVVRIFCRTDQSCICHFCMMGEHKDHDVVAAAAERTKKQCELEEVQRKSQQRLQEKEKKLQEVKQAVNTLKSSAQTAVEDSEKIFTELIRSIEKKRSEVAELIRAQEKTQLSRADELLAQLEQEIADLKKKNIELDQLLLTEDHIHFIQSFQSLCVSSKCEDSSSITVQQHLSFDEVKKSLSGLKARVKAFCREEFSKISPHAAAVQILLPEPKTREDFLQYYCQLTLDPNTKHRYLRLSEKNRVVEYSGKSRRCSDHPDRFENVTQILCKESLCGRCYWEVDLSRAVWGTVSVSVSYKGISRKGDAKECLFGFNNQSWSLLRSSTLTFCHNNIETEISSRPSYRIGVYVDHSAGILSFYSISDTMTLLHTVHTTFSQPLYAGLGVGYHYLGAFKICGQTVRLCDPE